MKLEFSRQISEKSPNTTHNENLPSVYRVIVCGQTDERTGRHDEANSRFFLNLRTHLKEILCWQMLWIQQR